MLVVKQLTPNAPCLFVSANLEDYPLTLQILDVGSLPDFHLVFYNNAFCSVDKAIRYYTTQVHFLFQW